MAEEINDYFPFIFTFKDTYEVHDIIPSQSNYIPLIKRLWLYWGAVTKTRNKIKENKTPGPDCITPRILKEVNYQISIPLAILVNKSLNSGRVLDIWKLGNVILIQKKGDKKTTGWLQTIKLTSVVGKIMETIIRNKPVTFVEENIMINNTQHGFSSKRSCLRKLLEFVTMYLTFMTREKR